MLIEITYNVTDVFMSTTETPVYVEISFEQPGGSAAVWGSITGTLSNQTDLQNALNAKFDDPTGTTTQYIDGTGALQTFPLTLPVLQEVRNQTGATLDAGTVVYINGATGNKPTVTKAIATGDATSAQTLGMISAAIANNGVGYVVVIGTCGGLDTSAYTEGQQLYLSGTVAGGVTTTKPYAPIHLVYVGIVTRAHPNLGTIEVRVQNGIEVDEIHNVSAQTPSNNDGLFYNTSTSLWESKSITTVLGYTPVPTTRNITINGVTYDLSADRTWTIAAGISGSGASGQVTYWTGASAVSGSNNLFWDNANGRLGIGTNTPTNPLHIVGINNVISRIRSTTNTGASSYLVENDVNSTYEMGMWGSTRAAYGSIGSDNAYLYGSKSLAITSLVDIKFGTGASVAERMRIDVNGNVGIGVTPTVRLQVLGDTLLRGSGATSATTALTVQNSSSTNLFTVRNDGVVKIGDNIYNDNNSYLNVGKVGGGAARIAIANNSNYQDAMFVATSVSSGNINNWGFGQRRDTFFGNTIGSFQIVGGYIDNSGVGSAVGGGYRVPLICNPNGDVLINGGNANVVNGLIGLKVNAPTAHVDITASTTGNASLRIRSGTAPTTPNDGDIWFDGTDIKMRIGGVTKTFTLT